MTRAHKIELWIALIVPVLLAATTLSIIRWGIQKPISLSGAILVLDSDARKQLPIAGVAVSADDLATSDTVSDSSGLFVLHLRKAIRRGHAIVIHFRDPKYRSLDLKEYVGDKLYVVHLVPVSSRPTPKVPEVKIASSRRRMRATSRFEARA